MQVTPEAGKDTAKRFGVSYDWKRLVSDPVRRTSPEFAAAHEPGFALCVVRGACKDRVG